MLSSRSPTALMGPLSLIVETARNITSTLKVPSRPSKESTPPLLDLSPYFKFSDPESLETQLLHIGLPRNHAQSLCDAFMHSVSKAQAMHRNICKSTIEKLAYISPVSPQLLDGLLKAHEKRYTDTVKQWQDRILSQAREKMEKDGKARKKQIESERIDGGKSMSSFNLEFVPILEAFFAEEQFPSRADKLFLAKKSSMTYRQIHVWFQNRRSRNKKPVPSVSVKLPCKMDRYHSSDETDVEDCQVYNKRFSSRSSSFTLVPEAFCNESPSHAYPTKYPPDFDKESDPFPCRFGDYSCLSKPKWERRSASSPAVQPNLDMGLLTEMFERLSIGTDRQSSPRVTSNPNDWAIRCFTRSSSLAGSMRPLPAPLPSLVRNASSHKNLRPCLLFRPQASCAHNFQHADLSGTVSSLHQGNTLHGNQGLVATTFGENPADSVPVKERNKKAKKKLGLPRRTPNSHPKQLKAHRDADNTYHSPSVVPSHYSVDHSDHPLSHDFSMPETDDSASSSETQSPLTPVLGLGESLLSFFGSLPTEDHATQFPATATAANPPTPAIPFDFSFDLSLKNTPDLSLIQNIFQPQAGLFQHLDLSSELSPAQPPLPFTFDFPSLLS